ncbi:MAG: LPS biosynthesis protein WbpP, partial [Bdellovibrionales bacterium]|nr:LPS biosynthesis protein WbpP [Bdellovibrionales bacterium]
TRDFCFVENVVEANILAATATDPSAWGEVYNIACGDRISLQELYYQLRSIISSSNPDIAKLEPEFLDFRKGDVRDSLASIEKARTRLGYSGSKSVGVGLQKTVEWFTSS